MNTARLYALAERWESDSEVLRRRGADALAKAWEEAARELSEELHAWEQEPLTLREAEEESGVAYSTLQQNVRAGLIPNAGDKGRPRIRRCDLHYRGAHSEGIADRVLLGSL